MKGAREFAELFETGQYGRLYLTSGEHARGKTFRIQVLPEKEKAKPNGTHNLCTNENAVEVYGIVGGNPGWTETYGWLYEGKWQEDFKVLVEQRRLAVASSEKALALHLDEKEKTEKERIAKLLSKY